MLDTLECLRFEQAASTLKIDLKQAHEEHKQNPLEAILDKFYQVHIASKNITSHRFRQTLEIQMKFSPL